MQAAWTKCYCLKIINLIIIDCDYYELLNLRGMLSD